MTMAPADVVLVRTFVRSQAMTLSRAHILPQAPAHPPHGIYRTRCGRLIRGSDALLVRPEVTPVSEICEACRNLVSADRRRSGRLD